MLYTMQTNLNVLKITEFTLKNGENGKLNVYFTPIKKIKK